MRRFTRLQRWPFVLSVLVVVSVTMTVRALRHAGYLEILELNAYDWSLRTQRDGNRVDDRVVLIALTEEDIQKRVRWPITDQILTTILSAILRYDPLAVGVDIYRDLPMEPGHGELMSLLRQHRNIIMVTKFGAVSPPDGLAGTDQVGFNDFLVDRDGVVRRILLFLDDGHTSLESFPLRLALRYLQTQGIVPVPDSAELILGPARLHPLGPNEGGYVHADDRGYQILLDFGGDPPTITTYSVSELLDGAVQREWIKGKLVLLGAEAESLQDLVQTPYSARFLSDLRGTYGVIAHAQVLSQLLHAASGQRLPRHTMFDEAELAWTFGWGLFGCLVGIVSRTTVRFLLVTLGSVLLLIVSVHTLFFVGWWVPLIPPLITLLSSASLVTAAMAGKEQRDRSELMSLFSRHVAPEVAGTIWRERDQFWGDGRLLPQTLTITVLFTDLEGFTSASEKMDAQAVMDWTNSYIDAMAQVIMRYGGVIDDYYGDGIKANFGVPVRRTSSDQIARDARNAVDCALAMEQEMRRLRARWQASGLSSARLRVGICTGPAVAGSLGSAQRLKYTTIGDTVNIAARLESFEKFTWAKTDEHVGRILVGESTLSYVAPHCRYVELGELLLKGKERSIKVYRILGNTDLVTETTQ